MNLEEVLLDDLMLEVMKRHEACVIIGLRRNYESPSSTSITFRYFGYPEICSGLTQKANFIIIHQDLNNSNPTPGVSSPEKD